VTLTSCRDCDADVSRAAEKCPKCGAPRPGLTKEEHKKLTMQLMRGNFGMMLIGIFVISAIVFCMLATLGS
jgi:ribosomal protein L40E